MKVVEMMDTFIATQQLMRELEVQANPTSNSKEWLMYYQVEVAKCLQILILHTKDLSNRMDLLTK
jgi:hypothetical protein